MSGTAGIDEAALRAERARFDRPAPRALSTSGLALIKGETARHEPVVRKSKWLREPPPRDDVAVSREELFDWVYSALRLPSQVVGAQRWGRHDESPVVIALADGGRIRFAQAREMFQPDQLKRRIVLTLGAKAPTLPPFSKADAEDIAAVIVRACEQLEADDESALSGDWQAGFLRLTEAMHLAYRDAEYRPPRLVWADGVSWVRVIDVEHYIRGQLKQRVSTAGLVALMVEAGWEYKRADVRRPGAGRDRGPEDRIRVSVFELPPEAPEAGVSPRGALHTSRAGARARVEGVDHLGTPAELPAGKPTLAPGDTFGPGDTPADPDNAGIGPDGRTAA